jgi:bifunctional UDP-N-acetylglucosamine pyrophosphorylase/glucosamine-1-phosphate N-acetyltransferase
MPLCDRARIRPLAATLARMADPFTVLIMAAGRGTRMHSSLPKVLHPLSGRPMVQWVIAAAREAGADRVICVTRPGDGVADGLPDDVEVAEQSEGEGTGAAVLAARNSLDPDAPVAILSGDHPLISRDTIAELLESHVQGRAAVTMLTTTELDPSGYGRIVRTPDGSVDRIVETKSTEGLSNEVLAIREINIGAYAFDPGELISALEEVELEQGELYLTGTIPVLRSRGRQVAAHATSDTLSAMGVNTRLDLMEAERQAQRRILSAHALAGVTFLSPETTRVEVTVEIGPDTTVGPGVALHGATRVGSGSEIGSHTTAIDAVVGDGVAVRHSYLSECEIRDGASIGPFAYLRPGTVVGEDAKVGAFVEIKNAEIGRGAKVPHLSYIGDADVGEEANVAAGNITANYDGREKHRTVIGKRAKTGVNTSFVAPVAVGDGAYTGAGSVITEDVPEGALGISRPQQQNVEGYAERVEKESER